MDEDLASVKGRLISPQEVDVAGTAGQKHFQEVKETLVAKGFIKLEEPEKLKNEYVNVNGGVENHSTGCPEDLPTTISLVVVDGNQELKGLSKAAEKLSLGSLGYAEEIALVRSANEAVQNHSVMSSDSENRNKTLPESFITNSRHNSVEMKRMSGNLKIEVIDDTAVIDCTPVASGNGYRSEKIRPRTVEKRDKRTRRRAQGGKQGLEANGNGKNAVQIVEERKNEGGTKKIYSRKEMEMLRYINPEEQRKMGMVVLKGYDGLANCEGKQGLEENGKGKNTVQIVEDLKNEGETKKIYSRKEMEALRYINPEEQRKMGMVVLKEYDGLANCEGKQGLEANGKGKNVVQIVEVQKNEGGTKKIYLRKEMEALRYINPEEQRKMWMVVRCSLGPVVLKEYDGLANCVNPKHIRVNFDPRQQYAKKEEAPAILGDANSSNVDDDMQNMNHVDPAYGLSVSGENSSVDPEEGSGDSDSDEDYSSIQRPAFLVKGEPNFDSGPPEDGLEYLRRVRWEAAQIPNVTVAKLDKNKLNKEQTVYMPKIPDIAKCPEHLAPLKQWEDEFLADFAELRVALSHLEDLGVEDSNRQSLVFSSREGSSCQVLESSLLENSDNLIIDSRPHNCSNPKNSDDDHRLLPLSTTNEDDGTSLSPENSSPRSIVNERSGDSYPLLSVIIGMDSLARTSILRKCINSLETKSALSRSDCMWLFALCAAVDTPLHADMCAALRSLLRKCASLRAEKSELDDEVIMLNILVTITGRYFKQSEN